VGVNERKQYMLTAEERCRRISELYKEEPKIEVQTYNDLTVDFAHRVGARYIIKGVRSMKDFEYEREQAEINHRIGDVETLLLYADPRYESISSSMVRELIHFGKDVKEFLP
jgi:pantetheine-phosphate adenylyltransferase